MSVKKTRRKKTRRKKMTDCAWNNPEIEADGFITPLEQLSESKARPATECIFPKCEECDKYHGKHCTVPIVVSKQQWLAVAQMLESHMNRLRKLESDVFILMLHNPEALKESV